MFENKDKPLFKRVERGGRTGLLEPKSLIDSKGGVVRSRGLVTVCDGFEDISVGNPLVRSAEQNLNEHV